MYIDWKKTLIVVCDIVVATYLLLAVTSFNKPDAKVSHCKEVKIDIEQNIVTHSNSLYRISAPERLKKRFKKILSLKRQRLTRLRVVMSVFRSSKESLWSGLWLIMARTTILTPMVI